MFVYKIGEQMAINLDDALLIAVTQLSRSKRDSVKLDFIKIDVFCDEDHIGEIEIVREFDEIHFDTYYLLKRLNRMLDEISKKVIKKNGVTNLDDRSDEIQTDGKS